jgi:hypothetical protein
MSVSVGGVSTNELLVGAAVIGGAILLYNFNSASQDLASVEDSDGCPEPSLSSVAGMLMEPWAYTSCAVNKIQEIPVGKIATDIKETAQSVGETFQAALGIPTPMPPNTVVETTMQTSDFQAWIDFANQLQKNNPTKVAGTEIINPYGCMDTRWMQPYPGSPAPITKVCNDNSGCYASAFYKVSSGDGLTPFGEALKLGVESCAVAADNGVLAVLDYDAVKADPVAIPLPSDSPQSMQQAGFGVSFENAANMLLKGYKMPPKGGVAPSATITLGNMNSMWHSNPKDDPGAPVPPGGWS